MPMARWPSAPATKKSGRKKTRKRLKEPSAAEVGGVGFGGAGRPRVGDAWQKAGDSEKRQPGLLSTAFKNIAHVKSRSEGYMEALACAGEPLPAYPFTHRTLIKKEAGGGASFYGVSLGGFLTPRPGEKPEKKWR